MDFTGITFSILVAVVSLAGLWWHVKLAKQGIGTMRDRIVAGLWAALLFLSAARIVWLVVNPADGTTTAPPVTAPPPLGK